MSPDTTGGRFGPTEEQEKLAKQLAVEKAKQAGALEKIQAQAAAKPEAATQGFAPGFAPKKEGAVPREYQALAKATLAGQQLGTPDSYGGQAPLSPAQAEQSRRLYGAGQQDFFQPIPVTRGMTTTYQGPQYGEELATPGQAAQAFRREQKAGEYVSGEEKAPEAKYKVKRADMELNYQRAMNEVLGDKSGSFVTKDEKGAIMLDEKGQPQLNPLLVPLALRFKSRFEDKDPAAMKEFKQEALNLLFENRYGQLSPEVMAAKRNWETKNKRPLDEEVIRQLDASLNSKEDAGKQYAKDFVDTNLTDEEKAQFGLVKKTTTQTPAQPQAPGPVVAGRTSVPPEFLRKYPGPEALVGELLKEYPGPEVVVGKALQKYPSPTDLPFIPTLPTPQAFKRKKEEYQKRLAQR